MGDSEDSTEEQIEVETIGSLPEEQIKELEWPRCKRCKRYTFKHDSGQWQKCKMSILSEDELRDHDKRIMELRMKKKAKNY